MSQLVDNIKAIWHGRVSANRPLFIGMLAIIVLAVVGIGFWVTRGSYEVLFSDLNPRDAAAIVEQLKRIKVPYRLADAGSKILVEDDKVHETRLRLMGQGIPLSGGVGFEIFDNKDVGMTEYTQRINYQRALQGELARTITAINEVKYARVHLVLADTGLFKREKIKPKASVSLVLKPGGSLSNEQIIGIQRLVSAAVPKLESGAVTILDQTGVTLSQAADGDGDYAQVSGKLRLKKNAEDYFIRKITSVLDRTFGPGQAIVSVDVTLNLDEVKRTQQTVVPLHDGDEVGAVVRKRQSVYRQSKGSVAKAVTGDTTYVGGSPDLTSTTDVEYELGKSVEQVVSSPGGVRRVSVGIVVPKINAEQARRVQDVVGMIVGYDQARGDAISVQTLDQLFTSPTAEGVEHAPSMSSVPARTGMVADPQKAKSGAVTGDVISNAIARFIKDRSNPAGIATLALLALLLGIFTTLLWSRRRYRRTVVSGSLDEGQRRARLAEIKSWLQAAHSRRPA